MIDKVLIRNINENDFGAITELFKELGYPSSIGKISDRLKKINESSSYKSLVVEVERKVVGFIGLCKFYAYEYDGEYVKIAALIVNGQHRGKGIGAKLIEAAEKWAVDEGAVGITLNSRINRKEAHEFYKSKGYATKGYSFSKVLSRKFNSTNLQIK